MNEILSIGPENQEPRSTIRDATVLAGVQHAREIGEMGPVVASRATPEGEKNLDLRAFEVVFGRDSIHTAYDLLEFYPKLAENTLIKLAELQGTKEDSVTEEEPGRIHHEHRPKGDPKLEMLKAKWGHPEDEELIYYGSVDATPMYAKLFTEYLDKTKNQQILSEKITNKDGKEVLLQDSFDAAINWILDRATNSELGFVEFKRSNPQGIANQIQKDSRRSLAHKDGSLVNHDYPVATIEVQGYAYDALVDAAELYKSLASEIYQEKIRKCQEIAEKLKNNVLREMWMEDQDYFATGIDRSSSGDIRQIDGITSNPGRLLESKLLNDPDSKPYVEATVRKLFSDEMFGIAGIRSMSKNEKRYAPGSYWNGSVWPADNEGIARGLEKQGYLALATEVRLRNHWAAFVNRQNAEFFRGDEGVDKDGNPIPIINTKRIKTWSDEFGEEVDLESQPQEIQAWTVSAVLSTKRKLGEGLMKKLHDSDRIEFEEAILDKLRSHRKEGLIIEKNLQELFKFRK